MNNKNSVILLENVSDQLIKDLGQHMAFGIVLYWTIVKFQNEIVI